MCTNPSALTAESLRRVEALSAAGDALWSSQKRVYGMLTPEQRHAVNTWFENEVNLYNDAWTDLLVAELCRHLPGLAPALPILWQHVQEERISDHGRCCEARP